MATPTATPTPTGVRYPTEYANQVLLADGVVVTLRPIRPQDAAALEAFHEGLSPETVYRRWFAAHPHLRAQELERLTTVDHRHRFALVALAGDAVIGVARYEQVEATDLAEVAFVMDDAYQGRGLGTLLLEHLAHAARRNGIRRFAAVTQSANAPMQDLLHHCGFALLSRGVNGEVDVIFDIEPSQSYLDAVTARAVSSMAAAAGPCLPAGCIGGRKVGLAIQDAEVEEGLSERLERLGLVPVSPERLPGDGGDIGELLSAAHADPDVRVIAVQAHHLLQPRTVLAEARWVARSKPLVALTTWPDVQPWRQAGATTVLGLELAAHAIADLAHGGDLAWHRPDRGSIDLAPSERRVHLPQPLTGREGDPRTEHATAALDSGLTRSVFEVYRLPVAGLPWPGVPGEASLVIGDEGGAPLTARMVGPAGITATRFLPLTGADARDLARLLHLPGVEEERLVGIIRRAAQLVEDEPAVRRLRLPLAEHLGQGPGRALILVGTRRGTQDDPLLRRTERCP